MNKKNEILHFLSLLKMFKENSSVTLLADAFDYDTHFC